MSSSTERPSQSRVDIVYCSHEYGNTRSSDEDRGDIFLNKHRLTFNGLHGVIFQKTELFTTTALGTSNPTRKYRGLSVDLPRVSATVGSISYPIYLSMEIEHICES
jgi:hypothetical protein